MDLFAVQISVLPLLLIPFYSVIFLDHEYYSQNPFTTLFKLLLAPFIYISLMSFVMLQKRPVYSKVYAGIRYGVAFGLFFLLCVFGLRNIPFLFHHTVETFTRIADWRNLMEQIESEPQVLPFIFDPYLKCVIALTYFTVFGAAIGGVVGLVCGHKARCIESAIDNQWPV